MVANEKRRVQGAALIALGGAISGLSQPQIKERAFEIILTGRLDYCSEPDLAEAKSMLSDIAHEIKEKFNRSGFVSRRCEYALIDDYETNIQ